MSETDLRIIFSRIDTLRIMSEFVAEGLEEAVPALDEKLVHDMIAVLDALLRAFGEHGRAEFHLRFGEYLEIDDHTLIERAADAVNAKDEFFGISRGSIVETIRAACPDEQDNRRRYRAKLIFMRRIGELCVFGHDYAKPKRGHLRLV